MRVAGLISVADDESGGGGEDDIVFNRSKYIELGQYVFYLMYNLGKLKDMDITGACVSDVAVRYLVASVLYIDKIKKKHANFVVNTKNVNMLVLVGVFVAMKIMDDHPLSKNYFSKLGGISESRLLSMERRFLLLCDYEMHVEKRSFMDVYIEGVLKRKRVTSDFSIT